MAKPSTKATPFDIRVSGDMAVVQGKEKRAGDWVTVPAR